MNDNKFISAKGELCDSVLINIAEILTLRLPEGVGWGFPLKFLWLSFIFSFLRANHRSQVGQKVHRLQLR